MGCVRDKIPMTHFAQNIFKFQAETHASVTIITKDESGKRLREGMTHDDFVLKLRNILASLKRNAEEANSVAMASLLGKRKQEDPEEKEEDLASQSNVMFNNFQN